MFGFQVPLTRKNLDVSAKNVCKGYNLKAEDRTFLLTPLFHVAGLLACLATLNSQGAVVLPPRYSPKSFWQDLTEHNVTWYTTTPTMHRLILQLAPPKAIPSRLRFIRCSSSPLPPALFSELESRFHVPVVDSYGLTETSSFCTSNPLPPGVQVPGSVGIPQGPEISIRDEAGASLDAGMEGEICMRGENITKGYINDPDANVRVFTPDGFFRTGDFGYLDANNYLFITGRIREFINKGGEKVSPVELDNIVTQHPAVAEAATFSVPDEFYGQDVGLAVTFREGEQVERSKLKRWIRERVSAHKVPAKIFLMQELPKTATGKTQRQLLSQQVADGQLASST